MRRASLLIVLTVFAFFPVKSAGQSAPMQNSAPPAQAAQDSVAQPDLPAIPVMLPPARAQGDLQAQIDEQGKTIQWLTEKLKLLEGKAADATFPWPAPLQTESAADGQALVPVQATSPQQPSPSGATVGILPGQSQRLTGGPPFANMPDSFGIVTANGQHELHLTGQIQFDERVYKNPNDTTDIDEFFVRRARLGVEGVVFNNYEFRILPDFGNNKQFVLQDALVNIHYVDWFQFMGGKFKEPVSFEEAFVQDRFVPTVERSIIDQITPQRDIGFMIYGRGLFGDQVDWYAGVFNGEINADVATTKSKNYAGRIAWRPLNYDVLPDWLQPLQFGVSGTIGAESEPLDLTGPATPQTLRTSLQVPWLTFVSTAKGDGDRSRVVPEFTYFYGPFNLCAEFVRMDEAISAGTTGAVPHDVRFEGYMVTATYMLTGEAHKAWGVFNPTNKFDPNHPWTHPGAWELVAAISRLHVDSSIFQPGSAVQLANPNGQSDGCTEITCGFNWYLNAFVKVQFNWEHAIFDQPVILNTASGISFRYSDALVTRLQLAF